MSSNHLRRSRLATSLLALAAVAALTAALAAPAGAVSGTGDAVIVAANHSKGRTLSGQGVKLLAGTGASAEAAKLTLPIAEVSPAGTQPSATSGGGLTFKRGSKTMAFTDLRFDLAAGTLAGKFQGGEVPIFWLGATPQVNSTTGTVSLAAGKLRLTAGTAQALKDQLGLERALVHKGVGMVWLAAKANPTQVKRSVTSGALEWGFLTSWREYIYKELGPKSVGSITTEGGATTSGEVAQPGSFFSFPSSGGSFLEGLYGASSQLALTTQGSVKFAKPGHCIIEIRFSNLAVSINGADSSIVGDLTYDIDKFTGKSCEDQPPVSAPGTTIATLDASGVAPSYSNNGKTASWANLPATLTAAAATPFAPQYKAGQALDPVTISVGARLTWVSPTRLCGIAAAALAVAAAALPAPSLAASGATGLTLDGPAAQALRKQGVRIAPIKPASGGSQKISLPLAAGLAGSDTTLLRHRGGIVLATKDGAARLTKLSLLLGGRSLLEARLGGEEIDLFKVMPGGTRKIDAAGGRVQLAGLRLKLTRGGAKALAAQLGLKALPAQRFATLSSDLAGLTRGDSGEGPSTGASPGGPAQQSSACQLPSGGGPSTAGPPPIATRPPAAVDVTGATINWHVRESFVRYIATGEGTSASDGATAEPPVLLPGASAPLSYDFHFPFANGWLDPGADPSSPSDDTAALYFAGALRFQYSGHGIDLLTASPEIELNGGSSRAIFAVSENGGAPQRQVLVNLDLGRAGAISRSGSSYVYDRVPGAIPAGTASSTFAGFYAPGTEFGCFTVAFSTG